MTLNQDNPTATRIGWVGTGVMGRSMCGHLLNAGYTVSVFNRTPEKAQPLVDRGATLADSPRSVAEASDVIFTIVGFPGDVREVILGEQGLLSGCQPGNMVIDMTTSEPSLAIEIFEIARSKRVDSIDAPVSGGDVYGVHESVSFRLGTG